MGGFRAKFAVAAGAFPSGHRGVVEIETSD